MSSRSGKKRGAAPEVAARRGRPPAGAMDENAAEANQADADADEAARAMWDRLEDALLIAWLLDFGEGGRKALNSLGQGMAPPREDLVTLMVQQRTVQGFWPPKG